MISSVEIIGESLEEKVEKLRKLGKESYDAFEDYYEDYYELYKSGKHNSTLCELVMFHMFNSMKCTVLLLSREKGSDDWNKCYEEISKTIEEGFNPDLIIT